ncbi:PQQ-binding-like beta-propeller repeat protein [Streptomyces sp. SID13666]|uniref:serine/threonine-protein kinase n=1 Tax=unclassified Streptomyces TaxID=2593676 RepID=UPI0013C0D78E|nr:MULTISPECIES: serine/threonine-protein kinase [unclassified Streptomyces]NEA54559.1 PQQ-binding-like beta-propeller repeat protein [Streptomyces sp. SID13666]NEA74370.1 PQQ-binding-like beta-propeller repeat protein [Streptomyces sp. SID13588]
MQPLEPEDPQSLGAYRLLGRLGAGGMGRVYLARSPGGRTVAVKVVRPELAEDAQFRARFRHEVEIARAVSGAYTAPVVDADTEGRLPWLATAYVLGPPLDEVIEQHGPLPEASVRALGAGLAEALVVIHGAGLVHRDLKPSNVLLAADGPRVIDFGIARAVDGDRMTSTGVVVGSPGFIPPEQAVGEVAGPAGDVFSLGVVLAYAATGQQPFGIGTAASLLYQVVHGTPNLTEVPASLRPLVLACLQKDPAQRPTPQQISEALAPEGAASVLHNWLPGPVSSTIAQHASRILDLDTPAHGTGAATVPQPPMPGEAPTPRTPTTLDRTALEPAAASGARSRRGFLALGAGIAVAAAGGGAVWAYSGKGGKDPVVDPTGLVTNSKGPTPDPVFTTPANGMSPKPLWRKQALSLSLQYGVPALAYGNLMIICGNPLIAHDISTGELKWSTPEVADLSRELVIGHDLLFFRSPEANGDFVGISPVTGKEVWRSNLGGRLTDPKPIAADDKHVYLIATIQDPNATETSKTRTVVAAVDIGTRKMLWQQERDPGAGDWDVSATTDGSYLVYADNNYNVTVREVAHGKQVWTKKVGEDAAYRPVLHGDKVVIGGKSMRGYDLKSGAERWSVPAQHKNGFSSPLSSADGVVYGAVVLKGVWAVDAKSGNVLWKRELTDGTGPLQFVRAGDSVYGVSYFQEGGIFAFDAKSGAPRWIYRNSANDGLSEDKGGAGVWTLTAAGKRLLVVHGDLLYALPAV